MKDPRLNLIKITDDNIKIYLIDADVTAIKDIRWLHEDHRHIVGNHHWGHFGNYIPKNEIWISNSAADRERIIFHELYERNLCLHGFNIIEAHELTVRK